MRNLTMLSGLPASGKSTLAKKMVDENHNLGRINRDDLRQMIFNGRWSNYNEKIIIAVEKAIADVLIDHERDVVVDDTNLGQKHEGMWKDFCNERNADPISEENGLGRIRFHKAYIEADINTCITRDHCRLNSVGPNVIRKMAARYGIMQWPNKPIVLVDIDGTLADGTHREHFVHGSKKDWDSYFSEQEKDLPITHIFKWVAELSKDHTIVIVSGRGAERELSTYAWFNKVWTPNPLFPELEVPKFPVFAFFFRDKGDRRPDDMVKREFLKLLPKRPVLVIDDRPSVIKMWREEGLRVIPVKGECEPF